MTMNLNLAKTSVAAALAGICLLSGQLSLASGSQHFESSGHQSFWSSPKNDSSNLTIVNNNNLVHIQNYNQPYQQAYSQPATQSYYSPAPKPSYKPAAILAIEDQDDEFEDYTNNFSSNKSNPSLFVALCAVTGLIVIAPFLLLNCATNSACVK